MNSTNKRDRLVNAAATLFHRKGIVATSLADIAKDADIPIGNVYYYFKTKDELAFSALARHKEHYIELFTSLNETIDDPRERLKKAIEYYEQQAEEFSRYGCPVAKMVMDTDTETGDLAKAAADVFQCFLQWAEAQFIELGHAEGARAHSLSLMSGIQGAIVLARAGQDNGVLIQELARLSAWVDQLPNKRIPMGKLGMKASAA